MTMDRTPIERIALRARFGLEQAARVGWYASSSYAATRMAARIGKRYPARRKITIEAPAGVPDRTKLLPDVRALLARDLANVEAGLYPMPEGEPGGLAALIARTERYFRDFPEVIRRRATGASQEVPRESTGRPHYYMQNFHFQSDGWMSEESAALYDTQVETLFFGAAAAMRRQALVPIAHELRRRDQRTLRAADIACGTGAFLREFTAAFPRLPVAAVDLSDAYVRHAQARLADRRTVVPVVAAAEALPFADGALDVATNIYLFHELPPKVRPVVAAELARVIAPGGLLVVVESLQTGDTPAYDGLLELFPQMFHEPYYASYAAMDLPALFAPAGMTLEDSQPAFLSKVFVFRKT